MSLTPDHLAPTGHEEGYYGGDCGFNIAGLLYDLLERIKKLEEIIYER